MSFRIGVGVSFAGDANHVIALSDKRFGYADGKVPPACDQSDLVFALRHVGFSLVGLRPLGCVSERLVMYALCSGFVFCSANFSHNPRSIVDVNKLAL